MPLTLSLGLPNFGSLLAADGYHALLEMAEHADSLGVDRLILTDHVVMGRHLKAYRWGPFTATSDTPWLEPMTTLAVIAARTTRIRLATGILIAPLRGAAVLAKTAATLDVLSRGRLEIGVGTGWQREEYEAAGLEFGRRGPMLSDLMAAVRTLWLNAPATISLPTVTFSDIYCLPRPCQPNGVPLWVAGAAIEPVFDRIVRWGDGWIPIMGSQGTDVAAGARTLRSAYAAAGRDPATVQVRGLISLKRQADGAVDWAATLGRLPRFAEMGVTDVQVMAESLGKNAAEISSVLADLIPRFRDAVAAMRA